RLKFGHSIEQSGQLLLQLVRLRCRHHAWLPQRFPRGEPANGVAEEGMSMTAVAVAGAETPGDHAPATWVIAQAVGQPRHQAPLADAARSRQPQSPSTTALDRVFDLPQLLLPAHQQFGVLANVLVVVENHRLARSTSSLFQIEQILEFVRNVWGAF